MISVKRTNKHLKYSPSKRRWNLDATSYGPALKLVLALFLLAALVLLTIYVLVPYIMERVESGASLFSEEPTETAAQETAEPVNPILTNTVKTVQFGDGYGLPTAVVDPSVYEGEILFATGASEDSCDRLVRLNPETGAFENIAVVMENDTLRYPLENGQTLIYIDAKSSGGGSIRMLDKATETRAFWRSLRWKRRSSRSRRRTWFGRSGRTRPRRS